MEFTLSYIGPPVNRRRILERGQKAGVKIQSDRSRCRWGVGGHVVGMGNVKTGMCGQHSLCRSCIKIAQLCFLLRVYPKKCDEG
jgi:hypothetical protein